MYLIDCRSLDSFFWDEREGWDRVPDNENLRLFSASRTPAEVLQSLGREKEAMRAELAADFKLRSDPKHRNDWDNLEALERCIKQRYYDEPYPQD